MKIIARLLTVTCLWLGCANWVLAAEKPAAHKTKNVIFVMTDGLRWQEVFRGVEAGLMTKENGGVADPEGLKKEYGRESEEERRAALLPFVWGVMAKQGQLYGNRGRNAEAYVTNGMNFSYPGYSETLCGFPDPRIDSNHKFPNPNRSVLEWLVGKTEFKGRVAAFGAWELFPWILNAERSGIPVNAGLTPLTTVPMTPRLALLNELKAELPHVMDEEPPDALTFHTAVEFLLARKPRVLYISLGETDEFAHQGDYTEYLRSAHRVDSYLKALWEMVQAMPEYRDATALIFSPDHGRGDAPLGWKDHGQKVPESKYIWMAFLGPDTPALGERHDIPAVTQSQIAATLAALLGEDYAGAVKEAGKPIQDVLGKRAEK